MLLTHELLDFKKNKKPFPPHFQHQAKLTAPVCGTEHTYELQLEIPSYNPALLA